MEKAETVPLHYLLKLEGIWDYGSFSGSTNLLEVLHGIKRLMFHGLLDFA